MPSGSPSVSAGQPAGWPAYGATPGGTHFSAASQITPDNVAWLEQAWVHNSGDFRDAGMSDEGRYEGWCASQVLSKFALIQQTAHHQLQGEELFLTVM